MKTMHKILIAVCSLFVFSNVVVAGNAILPNNQCKTEIFNPNDYPHIFAEKDLIVSYKYNSSKNRFSFCENDQNDEQRYDMPFHIWNIFPKEYFAIREYLEIEGCEHKQTNAQCNTKIARFNVVFNLLMLSAYKIKDPKETEILYFPIILKSGHYDLAIILLDTAQKMTTLITQYDCKECSKAEKEAWEEGKEYTKQAGQNIQKVSADLTNKRADLAVE